MSEARHTALLHDVDSEEQRAEVELLERAQPVLRQVAARLHGQLRDHVALDDLMSIGNEALVRLVRRYDPAVAPFDPYLRRFLRWTILDQLRRRAYGFPAAMRARALGAADLVQDTTPPKRLGAVPTAEQAHTELGRELALRAMALAAPLLAAHGVAAEQGAVAEDDRTPERRTLREHAALRLRRLVAELDDERARAIIERAYFDEVPFADVAGDLGLSKWQACRLHKNAMAQLARLARQADLRPEDVS